MTKDEAQSDDLLFKGEILTVRAMRVADGNLPARAWWEGLEGKHQVKFRVAAENVDVDFRTGRRSGRTGIVDAKDNRLVEFRVTRPGASAPHLRMLGYRDQNTLWMAYGFTKQTDQLDTRDIRQADNITTAWLAAGGPQSQ